MVATLDGTPARSSCSRCDSPAAIFTGPDATGHAGHAISADGLASAQAKHHGERRGMGRDDRHLHQTAPSSFHADWWRRCWPRSASVPTTGANSPRR